MPSNQNAAQGQFKQLAGTPARPWQMALARLSPKLLGRLTGVYEQSFADGRIPHKLRHLIWIAVDALPTHLYPVGVGLHAREAMKHGASASEIVEALEIASTVGERSFKVTLPIILEELQAAGLARPDISRPLTREAQAVKDQFIARDGALPDWLEQALRISPEFVGTMLAMTHAQPENGALDPKSREILFLAIHSCPATLDAEAIRRHTRRCLELGATAEELLEVLQYSSGIGIHAFSTGIPEVLAATENTTG